MGTQWTIQTAIQSTYKVWISEDTKSNSVKTIFILKSQITNSAVIARQEKSKSSVLQAENVQQPFEEHNILCSLSFLLPQIHFHISLHLLVEFPVCIKQMT